MITEEHVRNIKAQKKKQEVKLSVGEAKCIAAELTHSSFENSLKELLEEQLDSHQKEIRRIRSMQYCEHKWHEFTKEELYMYGSPRLYGVEACDKESIELFYMDNFGRCDKCGMRYRFSIFTDEDFERIITEYEAEDKITVTAHNSFSEDLFDRLEKEKLDSYKRANPYRWM